MVHQDEAGIRLVHAERVDDGEASAYATPAIARAKGGTTARVQLQAFDDVLAGREEDTPVSITTQDLIENDAREPGAPLWITQVIQGQHGTIVLHPDGNLTFTPDRDFFGDATFAYVVTDGVTSSTGHVVIHVRATNDSPDDIMISNTNVDEGISGSIIGTLSAHDVDSTRFVFSIVDRVNEFRVVTKDGQQMLALTENFSLNYDQYHEITVRVRVDDDYSPVGSYQEWITVTVNRALFTNNADIVDFNSLTPSQVSHLASGTNVYEARAGADRVTLPDTNHYTLPTQVVWNAQTTFNGGSGDDIIVGGNGADRIDGGIDNDQIHGRGGDDIIVGSPGNDALWGGDGKDIFDFTTGLTGFAQGTRQTLDGGADPDILKLPGQASDYTIVTLFGRQVGEAAHNIITSRDGNVALDTTGIEKVEFKNTPTNVVNYVGTQAPVLGGQIIPEMIRLAVEVYSTDLFSDFHSADPLANIANAPSERADGITNAAEIRGWHPLSAIELGMAAAAGDGQHGLTYAFKHGSYQAINPLLRSGLPDAAEANAMVLVGVVDGKITLALSFRGTDQLADFTDYLDFTDDHYAKYAPLIAAIDAYVADPANHIAQVLVSGHSLGGGMAQEYLSAHNDTAMVSYRAVTIGSPGSDNEHRGNNDARLLNFVHTQDPVPNLAPGASFAAEALGHLLSIFGGPEGQIIGAALQQIHAKAREGSTVYVDIPLSNNVVTGITEHARMGYFNTVDTLLTFANDRDSPFFGGRSGSPAIAKTLVTGIIEAGLGVTVAIGLKGIGQVEIELGDTFALGSANVDHFIWPTIEEGFFGVSRPWIPPSDAIVVIDGGALSDSLHLPGAATDWHKQKVGDHYVLTYGDNLVHVADLYRVEKFVFGSFTVTFSPASAAGQAAVSLASAAASIAPVVYLDGSAPVAQNAPDGTSAIIVNPNADYVTTGTGDRIVTGSAESDFIILGSGRQTIDGGAGNDIVNAQLSASGSVFTITGGAGNDTIVGASSVQITAVFSGRADDYLASLDGNGALVIVDQRTGSPDGIDRLSDVASLTFADGTLSLSAFEAEHLIRVLTGTMGADTLSVVGPGRIVGFGAAGDDILIGGSSGDVLDGGTGIDRLYGKGGDDSYAVDQQGDLVFEEAGGGVDTVASSANFYLYANVENLILAPGAGSIFGVGNDLANTMTGNEAANTLLAGAGADVVHGGAGVDIIYGEDGNDQLFGDADNDFLAGSQGDDVMDGGTGGDSLYGEAGNDTLIGGSDFVFDQLVGGDGNDVLHGDSGQADYDYLYGNAGDDSFYVDTGDDLTFEEAGEGTDTVYANIGGANNGVYLYANIENLVLLGTTAFGVGNELDNAITGSASANTLLGGAGADTINGKGGNDILFGQAGADKFVFEHGTGVDTIGDFTAGSDRIDLTAIGYTWQQVQNSLHEVSGNTAIDLGGGDVVILNGVTIAQLHQSDFILASSGSVPEPIASATVTVEPVETMAWSRIPWNGDFEQVMSAF